MARIIARARFLPDGIAPAATVRPHRDQTGFHRPAVRDAELGRVQRASLRARVGSRAAGRGQLEQLGSAHLSNSRATHLVKHLVA